MRGPRSAICAYFDYLFPPGVYNGQTAFSNRRTGRNCEKLQIFRHRTGKAAHENRFHKMKNLKIILFRRFHREKVKGFPGKSVLKRIL